MSQRSPPRARARGGRGEALNPRHLRPDLRQLALEPREPRRRRGHFLLFRQPQADDTDPSAADAARHQDDGVENEFGAFLRGMIEVDVEIVGQCQFGLLLIDGDAVNCGKLAERVLARHHEVAE